MNQLLFCNNRLPVINGGNLYAASEPFIHADRTLDFHVLIYVLEGVIYVTEGDRDYTVGPGELLFLKSGIRHFGKTEIPKGTWWYFVHFQLNTPDGMDIFCPDSSPIGQYEPIQFTTLLPKYLTDLSNSKIEQSLSKLITYIHSDDDMKRWNCNQILFNLLSEIAFYDKIASKPVSLPDQICTFLSEHYTEPFSASLLEQNFFLSYKYLAARFKQEKGLTMQQYHNKLRMMAASKLLRSTFLTIGEISEQVGFKDMLYFSKCFHRYFGTSPSLYRKNMPTNY